MENFFVARSMTWIAEEHILSEILREVSITSSSRTESSSSGVWSCGWATRSRWLIISSSFSVTLVLLLNVNDFVIFSGDFGLFAEAGLVGWYSFLLFQAKYFSSFRTFGVLVE